MDLAYAHNLLVAADQQGQGFLLIRGLRADHTVRVMAEVGLVDATLGDDRTKSFTAINRLTDLGRKFLRAFQDLPLAAKSLPARTRSPAELQSDSRAVVLEKWHVNFALNLRRPERPD